MRNLLIIFAALLCVAATTPDRYTSLAERAGRSFDGGEWAGAAALYELMLDMRPEAADIYARAIVASEMAGDTLAGPELVERAMAHGIGFAPLLGDVRATAYSIGAGDGYGDFLLRLQRQIEWMNRPLDHELLEYYTMRRDGPMMVKYAKIMLEGLPESTHYLSLLAEGYLLSGRDSDAVATWQHILQLYPADYLTLLNLGQWYMVNGETAKGRPLLQQAYDIHPTPYIQSCLEEVK